MSEPLYIKEQRLVDRAFERIGSINLPYNESRTVFLEKYKLPVVFFEEQQEYLDFDMGITFGGHSRVQIEWFNSKGNLNSFNDLPSRIVYGTYHWLELQWHKDGVPYRKNNMFNRVCVDRHSFLLKENELEITLEWLNFRGELHSFNDIPAKITKDSIQWYWNGSNHRRSKHSELPCVVHSTGLMKFCEQKDGVPETVNFPLSKRYYGKETLYNLNQYEKFVKWPIRKLLTL